jgi:Domain of unknown function (DUF1992)
MATQEKREQRLKLLEDHIGRSLAESEQSGELRAAPSYGKPLNFGDGYDETPAELRMPFKMLKDSGFVPPEVELMREIETLRTALSQAGDEEAARPARQALADKQQQLALRMEKLRTSGSL